MQHIPGGMELRLGTFCMLLLLLPIMAEYASSSDSDTYIIHMDPSKVKDLTDTFQETRQWYESIVKLSSEEKTDDLDTSTPQFLYAYQTALSGFAARLSSKQYEILRKADGVLTVTPDEVFNLHTTNSPQFLGLLQGQGLWADTRMSSDVIIGIVDTGVWPEHVSFSDSGMSAVPSKWKGSCETGRQFSRSNCNKKLVGARIFYKGYESVIGKINRTREFLSPRDSQGHGTHTAATAGGNRIENASMFGFGTGTASGISPGSRIAAYKACWSQGCASSDILAAIDQAVADGVDVLSLSLGGFPKYYYGDSIAIACFGAVQKGVFISCSAGNLGPISSGVSNTAPWIMTVGAGYTNRRFLNSVEIGIKQSYFGSSLYPGKGTGTLSLAYKNTAGIGGAEFCTNGTLDRDLVKGKIVACENGINSRMDEGLQVKIAGGTGVLLLNRENAGEELLADAHVIPAASLGAHAANAVRKYSNSSNPRASISPSETVYGLKAPEVAAFSSRGPNAVDEYIIKPDVIAPGVNILAAWPPIISPSMLESDKRRVQFNILSGTSMACPHVSGIAALLKSVHKDWSPAAIKSAMMTTAYTTLTENAKSPISDAAGPGPEKPANTFTFGSGHVDPERASDPGLIYDISTTDYLTHLCSLNFTSSQIKLFSGGNFKCPANAKSRTGDLNYPSFAVNFKPLKTTLTHKRTVTSVGKATNTYKVQVTAPEGVHITVKPSMLLFKRVGQKLSYSVTFASVKGFSSATTSPSFGSIVWVSGKYKVRSTVAATWGT